MTSRYAYTTDATSGSSETVDAVQTPKDMLHDMEGRVLAAGGVDPPYILMGSLVRRPGRVFVPCGAHPEDVVGMVLIDTMFPDELRLDHSWRASTRFLSTTTGMTSAAPWSGSRNSP